MHIYFKLNVSSYGCLLLCLVHYHLYHSGFLSSLICKFTLTGRRNLTFTICHLIVQTHYVYTTVSKLLTCAFFRKRRKQLYQPEYSACVLFLLQIPLSLRDATPFPPILFSEVVAHIYDTSRYFCYILNSILGSPDLLSDFLKNLHILFHSLFCEVLWVLTNV